MSATITNFFKINKALNNISSFDVDNSYFFAGKSLPWVDEEYPDDVDDSKNSIIETKNNIIFMKKFGSESSMLCIPRLPWVTGTIYEKYKSSRNSRLYRQMMLGGSSMYCINSFNQVYICLDTPVDSEITSTVEPTGVNPARFQTQDGYTWKFLFDLDVSVSTKFLKSEWIPVPTSILDKTINQLNVEDQAIPGTIDSLTIINGGSGYGDLSTISIVGDGTGATASLDVVNGVILSASINQVGSGYTKASVVISGSGINAEIDIEISPINGHGFEPYKDLYANYIICVGYFNNNESGLFPEVNKFRQIGIIANPTNNTNVPLTGDAYSNLTKLIVDTIANGIPFVEGEIVVGQTSGASGNIFSAPTDGVFSGDLSLINTYGTFLPSEIVLGEFTNAVVQTVNVPEVKNYSGDIIYIENIKAVTRHIAQAEKFSFVVEF